MVKYKNIFEKTFFLWFPVVSWAFVIFIFSAMPASPVSEIHWQDFIFKKSAHVVEYAIFTIFLYRALHAGGISKKEAGIYSIILAVIYGASDEFHQSFTPGREPKVRDVFFDTTGAFLAIYCIWKLLPKAPAKLVELAKDLQIV